jgi:hypothetical protein
MKRWLLMSLLFTAVLLIALAMVFDPEMADAADANRLQDLLYPGTWTFVPHPATTFTPAPENPNNPQFGPYGLPFHIVYHSDDPADITFQVLRETSNGSVVVLEAGPEVLRLNDPAPEENELLAWQGTNAGVYMLYRLNTGEYQMVVGPDREGRMKVTIYDTLPLTRIYGYEWNYWDRWGDTR